jgi:hypothetical protein
LIVPVTSEATFVSVTVAEPVSAPAGSTTIV